MEPDYLQQAIDALQDIESQTYLNNDCYLEVIALATVAIAQKLQEINGECSCEECRSD